MTSIRENARITRDGKVTSAKALIAAVITPIAEEATMHDSLVAPDHTAPCPSMMTTCIDIECQARKHIRAHVMYEVAEKDRPRYSAAVMMALDEIINDPAHAAEGAEFMALLAIEGAEHTLTLPNFEEHYAAYQRRQRAAAQRAQRAAVKADLEEKARIKAELTEQPIVVPHQANCACAGCTSEGIGAVVQAKADQAEAEATMTVAKFRKPRTATHQPRTTDTKEHPVQITMTQAEMTAAINKAVEAQVAQRLASIMAADAVKVAPEDKPVEIVRNAKQGGRAKIERITADKREFIATTLPAIVVNDVLTIPALEAGEESIDTIAPPKVRSPYNKARFRLDTAPSCLDAEVTTYRVLMAEHLRIAALVDAKAEPTVAAAVKVEKATKRADKAKAKVAPTMTKVVADIDPKTAAKAQRKVQIAALMDTLGITKAEAKAILTSV